MRYLRENKYLIIAVMILPVLLYLDTLFVYLLRTYYKYSAVNNFLYKIDPISNFLSNGGALITVAFVILLAGKLYPRIKGLGEALIAGFISSGILVQVLKHLVGRARPRVTDHLLVIGPTLKSGYDSFPSGHTTSAFCLAEILSGRFPRYRILFYLWAATVGFGRIEEMAHFPSDVFAGAVLGIVTARWLSAKVIPLFSSKARGRKPAIEDDLMQENRF